MEAEDKIRKTREADDPDRSKKRKLAVPAEGSPPSEEEVEEFFAIVRRMHAAVKYFERAAGGGDERGKSWRSALESGAGIAAAEGDAEEAGARKGKADAAPARASGAFDLNAAPEESPGDD